VTDCQVAPLSSLVNTPSSVPACSHALLGGLMAMLHTGNDARAVNPVPVAAAQVVPPSVVIPLYVIAGIFCECQIFLFHHSVTWTTELRSMIARYRSCYAYDTVTSHRIQTMQTQEETCLRYVYPSYSFFRSFNTPARFSKTHTKNPRPPLPVIVGILAADC
jgi:hypothetical protein